MSDAEEREGEVGQNERVSAGRAGARVDRSKQNVEAMAGMSPVQQGILFHSLGARHADPYYCQLVFAIDGVLDRIALRRAWQLVVDRHQVLRAEYRWEETSTPLQVIFARCSVGLVRSDWSMFGVEEQKRRLQRRLARDHEAGFDFRHAAEARLELIECAKERHWLIWSFHHLVLDGWSVGVVLGEVLQAYEAFASGLDAPRLGPALPYVDYIAWLRDRDTADAVRYWEVLLRGLDGPTPLPARRKREASGHSERRLRFDANESGLLRRAATDMGVTLGTLVQGAWAVLLGRHADVAEVVFGVTVSGRAAKLPGIEKAVGLFINTLPVRIALPANEAVRDWLLAIQAQNVESGSRDHLPPSAIARAAGQRADVPLFDTAVVFNNYPIDGVLRSRRGGLHVEPVPLETLTEGSATTGRNNYALSLVAELGERLDLVLAFERSQFRDGEIDELGQQLRHVLWALSRGASEPLGNVGLSAPVESGRRSDARAHEPSETVLDAFRAAVARAPDALALCAGTSVWSYAGLERASSAVAHDLIARGIRPEEPVVILAERSGEFVTALLGVLAAGAAYVPVEQSSPPERLREIVLDSGARFLVTTSNLLPEARKHAETALAIEDSIRAARVAAALPSLHPDRVAYVIYTSGSTGKPKGVAVSHGALALYVRGMAARAKLGPDSTMGMVSTISADLGHTVLFGALCLGARLDLVDERTTSDPDAFASHMQEHGVDVLKIVPSHLKGLLYAGHRAAVLPRALLILGGEASSRSFVQELREASPGCRIMNHYGPTETTVGVAMYELGSFPEECESLPIGTSLAGAELYVLDRELNRVPSGVDAELYIGGARLARGYWANPRMTAERFVPDPYGLDGGRMYRTGDRVRLGRDGDIEFLGRRDRQVKIRGYRVELQEIEQRLIAHDGVREAVVLARTSPGRESSQLYAYVTGSGGSELPDQLQRGLSAVLPQHMVPARIVKLDRMPITANGKLDRRALESRLDDTAPAEDGVEPQNPIERALRDIWQEVLRRERIGVEDNFFEAGGDSILSLQIVAKARRRGLRLTPKQLFELQTIRRLAAALARPQPEREPPPRSKATPIELPSSEAGESGLASRGVPAKSVQQILPVTSVQHGMLLHSIHGRAQGVYISQVRARVSGLDVARFERAWRRVEERHDALRSAFIEDAGAGYVQVIEAGAAAPIEEVDWSRRERPENGLEELAEGERVRGFELGTAPLQRVVLVRLSSSEHELIWTHHHVLLDGWSRARLIYEVSRAYHGKELEPAASYAEHAKRAAEWDPRGAEAFWRSALRALDNPTLLARALRPTTLGSGYGQLDQRLSAEQTGEIVRFARKQRVTLNTVLQAAWLTLLRRHTGQRSVAFGATVSGRSGPSGADDNVVGLFINTVPVIGTFAPGKTVGDFLRDVQALNVSLREHEGTPLHEIQRYAGNAAQPLFDSIVVFENYPVAEAANGAGDVRFTDIRTAGVTNFPLTLEAQAGERLALTFTFDQAQFDAADVREIATRLTHILQHIAADAETPVETIPVLTERDRGRLGNMAFGPVAALLGRTVPELIDERAEESGDAVALVFGEQSVSYGELNARANQLARRLRAEGVGADVLVGLCAERSLELVVGLLGILKAGGGYLPLEPSYPKERLRYLVEDGRAGLVLTEERWLEQLGEVGARLWCLDRDWAELEGEERGPLQPVAEAGSIAYCIHTSGSTGRPKGVLSTHEGLSNRLQWMQRQYELTASDCVLQKTPFSFDVSVWEFLWPLMVGAKLVVAAPGAHRDPGALRETIVRENVTTVHFVPSMLEAYVEAGELERSKPLRQIMSSGEALGVELSRRVQARHPARLHNLYGPTEASIDVTHWSCGLERERVPIGKPIANTAMHVLDGSMNPVPVGVSGELYIGGVGLARGYVGRAGQTAERFVPNPFGEGGERLYRTGDIGRYRPDGALEYLERADHQVKIRGHRIELGEIESRLREHGQVREAVVLAQQTEQGARLVGYVVLRGELAEAEQVLRGQLRRALPEHMVPQRILVLESLPLTHNGKLDKKALPEPEREPAAAAAPPKTPLERALAEIWSAALAVPDIGVDDDFFERGGHSLLAIRVAAQMSQALGKSVPVAAIFEAPTIARILGTILTLADAEAPTVTLIEPGAGGAPLFCIHDGGGYIVGYRALAKALGGQRAVYGVQSRMFSRADWVDESIGAMSSHYADCILQHSSEPRVAILGWSSGGRIALETARQLMQRGCDVVFVGTVDDVWLLDESRQSQPEARPRSSGSDREATEALAARFLAWADRAHFATRWRRLFELFDDETKDELLRLFEQRQLDRERLEASAEYLMLRDAQYRLLMVRHELRALPVLAHAWWARDSLTQRRLDSPTLRPGFLARSQIVEGDHFSVIDSPRLHEQLRAILAEADSRRQHVAGRPAPEAHVRG